MRLVNFAFTVVAFFFPAETGAADLEPGLYLAKYESEVAREKDRPKEAAKAGRRAERHDGGYVYLGKWLGRGFGTPSLRSVSNNNTHFVLELAGAGPLPKDIGDSSMAVVIEGLCVIPFRRSELAADGTANLAMNIYGRAAALNVAKYFRIEPEERKHPGHRFEVRWTPDKATYKVGESITLAMSIHNSGDTALTFFVGGKQRGPRDNQFRFLAYASGGGKAVPDTGDSHHHGGLGSYQTLKPGEAFTRTVQLDKWFRFTEPDTYEVTGIFEFTLYGSRKREFDEVLWNDLAAGECLLRIEK